ncbi:hypothetical protein [Nocardioides dongxiaopingii]|uniref:hypothetical protein n=1 Tax=Nocardioides dongxiaopingii TaxID=2576036 RepID=UPI0010C767F5|nr:hypothetical protein [Nocardioides dongxiaopingii]
MTRLLGIAVAVPFVVALSAAAASPEATVELTFTDPEIVESSGLVARDGLFVTVNDSGDTGQVFTVDPATGDTVGVTTWSGDPTDVEAVAPAGDGEVWVADIGDNLAARQRVTVSRVPVGRGDRDVDVVAYELDYPGPPQDAETLMVEPGSGRLVVVTKGVFGGEVFVGPDVLDPDGPNPMRRAGVALGIATDGSFFPDGRHVVVRGYGSAAVYTWPDLDEVGRFDLPAQQQGEGIAVDEDGAVFVSSEGMRSDVLRVALPRGVARAVAPDPTSSPTTPTTPTTPPTPPASAPAAEGDGAREASEVTEDAAGERSAWPWALGGVVGLVAVVALVRSLRPRPRA